MKNKLLFFFAFGLLLAVYACSEDPSCDNCGNGEVPDEAITGPYNPQGYQLPLPEWLNAAPLIPNDNPLTVEGVELGRRLFYDPVLSVDSTVSCASCHRQELAFTDGAAVSIGVAGRTGSRNSMSLVNLAWNPGKFFWDGRSATLEAQALIPVEDHREMADNWDNVEDKLRRHPDYPRRFRAAFGIDTKREITRDLVVKAISQFERTLLSFNSRFDQVVNENNGWFSDYEELGRDLFFIEDNQDIAHPGCSHCHVGLDLTDHSFRNNGLTAVDDLNDFPDQGLGGVTGNYYDNGKFKVPSLRNIELTAPYMHDGRFATLEEVLESYSQGGHGVENEDVNIQPFPLNEEKKLALVAFLKTLTDTSFVNNPAFSNPFE